MTEGCRRGGLLIALLVLAVCGRSAELEIVARELNNPRGLDFGPGGALYIAEAGVGGDGPTVDGPEGPVSFGLSGSITRVFHGVQERIVTGLPSLAREGGVSANGPSNISFGGLGQAFITIGLALPPALRNDVLGSRASAMATLQRMNPVGRMRQVVDLGAFEAQTDPDGYGPDSNPTGVLATSGGQVFVVDAGANALLRVERHGAVSVIAIFPNRAVNAEGEVAPSPTPTDIPIQSVPTSVVRGPDGALYIGELTGYPFVPKAARIYRVEPGSAPTVYAEGFTHVIDLEFDARGNLYVLEIDTNGLLAPEPVGRLARVNSGSGTIDTVAVEGLVMPGGLAIGPDRAIYISNFGISAGTGQVVRIRP